MLDHQAGQLLAIDEDNPLDGTRGFTGTAGWLFHEAVDAAGSGTASDFAITYRSPSEPLGSGDILGQLVWSAQSTMNWIAREPVTFFFVSPCLQGLKEA
jgi:hypothetical protein